MCYLFFVINNVEVKSHVKMPSKRTLQCTLNDVAVEVGINGQLFPILLKKLIAWTDTAYLFDEISLLPNMCMNVRQRCVEGIEDFWVRGTKHVADDALVFLIRGINKRWIFLFFVE